MIASDTSLLVYWQVYPEWSHVTNIRPILMGICNEIWKKEHCSVQFSNTLVTPEEAVQSDGLFFVFCFFKEENKLIIRLDESINAQVNKHYAQSSGAVWRSRWTSWAPHPQESLWSLWTWSNIELQLSSHSHSQTLLSLKTLGPNLHISLHRCRIVETVPMVTGWSPKG